MFRPENEHSPETVFLTNPTDYEIDGLRERYDLHPLIIDDLRQGRQQPKFERPGAHLYLSLWDRNAEASGSASATESDLALIFNEDFLLVVQRGDPTTLRDLNSALETVGVVPITSTLSTVYRVLDIVVSDFVMVGSRIERELAALEDEVFDSEVHEDYRRIYQLRSRIGQIDRAASGMAQALRNAQPQIHKMSAREPFLRPYFQHLEHDASGAASLATELHKGLDAVVASHESNVAKRQNEDMRTISAYAALLAIPTVISGVYGMNFKNLPLLDWETGWLISVVAMIVLDVVAYVFFRRRGWLGGKPATRNDGEPSAQS